MTSSVRNLILWVIVLILVASVYALLHGVKPSGDTPSWSGRPPAACATCPTLARWPRPASRPRSAAVPCWMNA